MKEAEDQQPLYYSDYLELDKILNSQHPKSFSQTNPSYDEMLFIIVHQAYELWFKQILFELDLVIEVFKHDRINDNSPEMGIALHRLKRVVKIFELIIRQVEILETMTPLDFLEFRGLLSSASGFQSKQFKFIEAKLGLQMEQRHDVAHYKHTGKGGFSSDDYTEINVAEEGSTLKPVIAGWLERMPFFEERYWDEYETIYQPDAAGTHKFWSDYGNIYADGLGEGEGSRKAEFEKVFLTEGLGEFSAKAMRAMLFIMLYRDLPIFQLPFELLSAAIEIDELLSTWRYRHLQMVRRMIGMRMGTGGKGAGYLEGTLSRHQVFRELTEVTTFVIKRSKLPVLPTPLKEKMGFSL